LRGEGERGERDRGTREREREMDGARQILRERLRLESGGRWSGRAALRDQRGRGEEVGPGGPGFRPSSAACALGH
jgi:hypothetical protein